MTTDGAEELFVSSSYADKPDKRHRETIELSVSQAAQVLGVSERTLWRHIDSGKVKSRVKDNKRLVRVPVLKPLEFNPTDNAYVDALPDGQIGTLIDLKPLLHELNAANYRVGYLQSQVDSNQAELLQLPDLQARALAAEQLKKEADAQRDQIEALKTEIQTIKSKWFYRFWAWLSGS